MSERNKRIISFIREYTQGYLEKKFEEGWRPNYTYNYGTLPEIKTDKPMKVVSAFMLAKRREAMLAKARIEEDRVDTGD